MQNDLAVAIYCDIYVFATKILISLETCHLWEDKSILLTLKTLLWQCLLEPELLWGLFLQSLSKECNLMREREGFQHYFYVTDWTRAGQPNHGKKLCLNFNCAAVGRALVQLTTLDSVYYRTMALDVCRTHRGLIQGSLYID